MSAPANIQSAGSPGRASRLRAQDGMTMMEVLVAAVVLILGLLGYLDAIGASGSAVTGAERAAAMTQIGDQTLQTLESLPYASISDSSAPTHSTATTNPAFYVITTGSVSGSACTTGTTAAPCYQWNSASTVSAEPIDFSTTTGRVAPGPTTVVAPSVTGTCTTTTTTNCQETFAVYAFVTDSTDSVCGTTCSGTSYSYKRVTVAVKNTGPGGPYSPLYFSTIVYYPGSTSTGATGATGAQDPLYGATGATGTTTCADNGTTVACTH
jgi:Tfp pilus assembly protein PilV